MDIATILSPLAPLIKILSHKYFGIPLVIHIIGFTHLAIMIGLLFGQTILEIIEKQFDKA